MDNNVINGNLDSQFNDSEKFIKTETVVGKPIFVGEVIFVPIISVIFEGNSEGGIGVRIIPTSIFVVKKEEVTLLPISKESNIDNLLDVASDVLSKLNIKKSYVK